MTEWSNDWNLHTESGGFQGNPGIDGGHWVIITNTRTAINNSPGQNTVFTCVWVHVYAQNILKLPNISTCKTIENLCNDMHIHYLYNLYW